MSVTTTTVAFDVDGTLITYDDVPRYDVIQLYHLLESFGCQMFIWSGCGIDYAQRWSEKLGLKGRVVAKGSFKPHIAIDDFPSGIVWEDPLGAANICVMNKAQEKHIEEKGP